MKKKAIIGLIIVLLISIVVINNNKKNISYDENTLIAVYLGNTQSNTYPSKESNYVFDASRSNCNNGATITWDEEEWGPKINTTKSYTKCDVYFKTLYKDNTGASIPELHEGMIPIKFDGTTMKTANVSTDTWYNYASHNWANAALINYSNTTTRNKYFNNDGSVKTDVTIDTSDLLQMYVWIPRYRYKLWNATMGTSNPQAIEIEFENKDKTKSSGSTNGEWLTHPAFTFGETELNGIWVGKFEMTGTESQPTILPNQQSLVNITLSEAFYSIHNMSSTVYGINKNTTDTHVIKPIEWGAVAYLSHSIYGRYQNSSTCIASGCEVWINNINTGYGDLTQQSSNQPQYGPGITGCSGDSVSANQNANKTACESGYDWTTLGVNASTTGNIYGIYDMSGGAVEFSMGLMLNEDNSHILYEKTSFDENTLPNKKYYDEYLYEELSNSNDISNFARFHLGDGSRETMTQLQTMTNSQWYGDNTYTIASHAAVVCKGGYHYENTTTGLFLNGRGIGHEYDSASSRAVLTKS